MPIIGVLFLYVLLFMFARWLDARITARELFGGKPRPGQAALDVVIGTLLTLAVSVGVSMSLSAYPFFTSAAGTYCIILLSFVVSGVRMIWGDIERDRRG